MQNRILTEEEERGVVAGETITLTAVLAIMAIGLVAIIAFKFFTSNEGKAILPGGFTFQWK